MGEEEETEISMKFFVGILRDLKKMEKVKIYLLPITQVVTTFLENIKEFVGEQTMSEFEETFFEFISFVNRKYLKILKEYQTMSSKYANKIEYYIEC
jgi:anaerobic ribonucleoside-triphosphate reductase